MLNLSIKIIIELSTLPDNYCFSLFLIYLMTLLLECTYCHTSIDTQASLMTDFNFLTGWFQSHMGAIVKVPCNATYRRSEEAYRAEKKWTKGAALACTNTAVKGWRPIFQFNETHISKWRHAEWAGKAVVQTAVQTHPAVCVPTWCCNRLPQRAATQHTVKICRVNKIWVHRQIHQLYIHPCSRHLYEVLKFCSL